jgi:transcriptional regulator with XRE-family HTH domain
VDEHLGTRVAYWRRRRGMTQTVLAGLAGVSQSYISQVEACRKAVERRSTLVAIASALHVTVPDLVNAAADPTDPRLAAAAAAVPAIRAALVEIDAGERRTPLMHPDHLAAAVKALTVLRARADYAAMAPGLAPVLFDAAANGVVLAEVGYATGDVLKILGHQDLALTAARVAVRAAQEADDAAWIGATRYFYTAALPVEAAALKARTATRALTDLQAAAADPAARAMLGQLHLAAALASAVDELPADAAAHLAAAAQEAATLGDPEDGAGFNLAAFGPTNVGLWRMAVAAELGEHGRVLELGRTLQPRRLRVADRRYAYWTTYGAALAHARQDRQALVAFIHAERAAPTLFTLSPSTRATIASILYRARSRSVSDDLRTLARRAGLDPEV